MAVVNSFMISNSITYMRKGQNLFAANKKQPSEDDSKKTDPKVCYELI